MDRAESGAAGLLEAAGNGLLDRRAFLRSGAAGLALPLLAAAPSASANRAGMAEARSPGRPMSEYGHPASSEAQVVRQAIRSQPGTSGSGSSSTPLQHLRGTLTPAGLHFERHHAGVPQIEPEAHSIEIGGAVGRALRFDLDALHRYPMTTQLRFLECSGNSRALLSPDPLPWNCAELHGLVSTSEWTGVPLGLLLDEAGLPKEREKLWVVAEGGDACRMNRSVPLEHCLDRAIVALYQNGERLRPENGYPARLFLPGFEGNMSIKWLRRLEVSPRPAMSREETAKYTDLRPDGSAIGFSFQMGVKSVITSPSAGLHLDRPGIYQISGLAWSGAGAIRRVEVSADGGRSWIDADFESSASDRAQLRFRAAWNWRGQPAVLLSRATDRTGAIQPSRAQWLAEHGPTAAYHCNAIQAWQVNPEGSVKNVYAG